MSFFGHCPRCGNQIPPERFVNNGFAVCECGWTDSTPVLRIVEKQEKKSIGIMIAMALLLIGGYAHLVSWGSYAVAIPFVKVQKMTGTLSNHGYIELAEVCTNLNKWSCAKDAYMDLYKSKRDMSGVSGLAKLHTRLGENENAMQMYAFYFQNGGKEGEAAIQYGKLLELAGRNEDAMKMYEFSIAARPGILPVEATTQIVRFMIKQGKYEEALDRITAFHESSGNAKGYLNTELQQLESYFSQQAKSGAKPRKTKPKRVASR